jgi:phosphomevalonate kinase
MIAAAPGKVVLSGAYAVLCGAPALVAAVDRYAVADTARPADRSTPEIDAALAQGPTRWRVPFVDATALRSRDGGDRKLGLGSSAAMLVAALAALQLDDEPDLGEASLRERVFAPALRAHRTAQPGGSGIDVAASTFGGVQRCGVRTDGTIDHAPATLPEAIRIEIWSARQSASTPRMVERFWALRDEKPAAFGDVVRDLSSSAEAAIAASDATRFVDACRAQLEGLSRLGREAGSPIVTPDVSQGDRAAARQGAVVLPSGAGGGDIALWIGPCEPDASSIRAAESAGFTRLPIGVGAQGVHCASFGHPS